VPEAIYREMADFYRDLGLVYRKVVGTFAEAGCRYLQPTKSTSPICPAALGMINAAIAGAPADMTMTMHLCRGNFRSSFVASGGYEPIAEMLFNTINLHGYFMEYDSVRAGGFEPLRFVPKGKSVVLGLVTTKTGELERRDEIIRRIEEAAKFVDIDQLCLSPQCGFASTEEGNTLAEDEQWAKLAMIVKIAEEVWG
jgi:5-methyltetrahydropteroyltriglutamate--homocysteine methyltransferase